ncbi:TPA: V-type ATP synthase subunit D [Candidatus Woesearchaeota archaeon]|nr:V-type ATP synthase subunit D [Candidatus Woesearchaeota archaeon]|tara:strand:+ start:76 stop:693 length:618 start_codon:yes stop_codon:yes gene_type:complete
MALDIKPTRSELLKLKKQIKLAKSGHSLLKKKRDGLILEFFELLKTAKNARSELVEAFKGGKTQLGKARVMHTDVKLQSLAFAISTSPSVELEEKNIMGVRVPKIEGEKVRKTIMERGIGMGSSTPIIDTAISSYEQIVESVIHVAEAETAMKRLLAEIEKTKRRVNALEFNRIPAMDEAKKFIQLRLEEMERENVFRLKRIKGK